jgi:hypothetical protein
MKTLNINIIIVWKIYKLLVHNLSCSACHPSPAPFHYNIKSPKIYKNYHTTKMIVLMQYGDPYSESQNPEGPEIRRFFLFYNCHFAIEVACYASL